MRHVAVLHSSLMAMTLIAVAGCSSGGERAKPAMENSSRDSVTFVQKPGAVYMAFQYVSEIAGTELKLRLCDGDTAVAKSVGAHLV